jgi:alpha-mannosidase
VHADRSAAETQFGHVMRATHTNTSWDEARYEICAHRWLHVGEPGYGVSIANDATYGHDVTRVEGADGRTATVVRQSLLRAPLFPDPEADQGEHTFRTVLHVGAEVADAVVDGYRANLPLRTITGGSEVTPLVTVSAPGVVVEALKLADDGSGDVVVRLHEACGDRARITVAADGRITAASRCDLLEAPTGSFEVSDGIVATVLRPFELLTLRLRR